MEPPPIPALDTSTSALVSNHLQLMTGAVICMTINSLLIHEIAELETAFLYYALYVFFVVLLTADKEEGEEEAETSPMEQLPAEVMIKVMSYLSPKDLCRCAQVSQHWNQVALDPCLWPGIYPVQWAAGKLIVVFVSYTADMLYNIVLIYDHTFHWKLACDYLTALLA